MNILQRLGHRLFGWHYLYFQFSFDPVVRRIRVAPNGGHYIKYGDMILTVSESGVVWNDNYCISYMPLTWNLPEKAHANLRVVK